jgi:MFS family permease
VTVTPDIADWTGRTQALLPGVTVAVIVALASQFISDHYGAPAMLLALLFGISLNFLGDQAECGPGIAFGARTLLRLGVALLGLRISFEMVGALGWPIVALVVGMVPATIAFGLAASRFFGFRYRFAFLSAGAVAICGASAAMAIAADPAQGRTLRRQAGLHGGRRHHPVDGGDDPLPDPQPARSASTTSPRGSTSARPSTTWRRSSARASPSRPRRGRPRRW